MLRPTTLIVSAIIILGIAIGGGFYGFPKLIKSKIVDLKQLKKGSQTRKDWTDTPLAIDFKIYLFNVTNANDVNNGAKPEVTEIGPFFYREWKSKVNLVDNQNEDTITFQMKNTWYFDKKETKPLTGDEIIVVPHIILLAFVELTKQIKPSAIKLLDKAIPYVFNLPQSVFVTTTPRKILFDGITVNCSKFEEFAANAICDQIRDDPSGMIPQEDNTFKFSIFGAKNGTTENNTLTVKRGMRDIKEVGQVIKFNDKNEMDMWDSMPCNRIKGSDTTIYAPSMKRTEDIWNFSGEICRSIRLKYIDDREYKDIRCLYYEGDLGDMSTDVDLRCFCPLNTTGECLKKGVMDIQKCTGVPLIVSLPHCYLCDPEYLNAVIGLDPDKEKHNLFSYFEPITGIPVSGRRRLQFNMWLNSEDEISIMKNLPEKVTLMPLFWIEEGISLNDTLASTLKQTLYGPALIVNIVRISLLVFGTMLLIGGIYLSYKRGKLNGEQSSNEDTKTNVTQVGPGF